MQQEDKDWAPPLSFNYVNIIPHFISITEKTKTRMHWNVLLSNWIKTIFSVHLPSLLGISHICTHPAIWKYTCACTRAVGFYTSISHFLVFTKEEVLKSHEKKSCSFAFTQKEWGSAPKSRENLCWEMRFYHYRQMRGCTLRVYISEGLKVNWIFSSIFSPWNVQGQL